MKKIITLILLIGSFNITRSQEGSTQDWSKEDQRTFESATELFNKHYYESAYEKYVSLQPRHEDDLFLKFVRGVCAVYISGKHKEAEKLLLEVKKNNSNAENIDYYLALLFHKSYRFDKALEITNALLSNPNLTKEDRADLERVAFFSKNGKNEIQYPFETMIEPLSGVNSEYAEYGPVISPEEESIIFTYRGKGSVGGLVDGNNKPNPNGDYNEDIFISKKVNGVWQKPTGIAELNTIGNDAAIALSPDGKQLFVFKVKGDNGDIYVCNRKGSTYLAPEKLAGEVNSEYWEGSVSISTDQQKLYFASSRPGGFGGKDLYIATKKEDGTWGSVKNLGDKINTPYDEDAPFISPDNRALIFSSEGHNSIGDFDLFASNLNLSDGTWQEPKNLGYPINTTDDDLFYVLSPDGKRGYFSSAREGGKGDQDIYVVEPALASKKTYLTIIKGKVTENTLPFETEISVSVAGETKSYGSYKSGASSGNYVINLPTGRNYKLSFNHPTLGSKIYNINTEQVEDYAEKVINVNFNTKDNAKFMPNTVVVTKADSAKHTSPVKTETTSAVVVNTPETKTTEEKTVTAKNSKTKTSGKNADNTKETILDTPEENVVAVKTSKTKTSGKNSSTKETVAETPEENVVVTKITKTKTSGKNTNNTKETVIETTSTNSIVPTPPTIANTTSGCKSIRTKHDADFDYKKCNGIWFTRSKSNTYSKYAKGFFKEWVSLADVPLAIEKLNKRYPKG